MEVRWFRRWFKTVEGMKGGADGDRTEEGRRDPEASESPREAGPMKSSRGSTLFTGSPGLFPRWRGEGDKGRQCDQVDGNRSTRLFA